MTPIRWFTRLCALLVVAGAVSACTLIENAGSLPEPTFEGAPVVQLASPLPNEIYAQGAAVNILGRVENAGEDIAMVDILLDGQSIGSAPQPNASGAAAFTITNSWQANAPGERVITLRAVRADGTAAEARVTISVESSVAALPPPTATEALPTATTAAPTPAAPAQAATPTPQPDVVQAAPPEAQPTTTPTNAAPASNAPTITVISGANIRRGPGMVFAPPLGSLMAGQTGVIVAISPDRQWYRITYNDGAGRGWINAATVTTSGDLSRLPIDPGPATPAPTPAAPPPPTSPAQTAVPLANTDLSLTFLATNPDPLVCNEDAIIQVIVVNTGPTPSAETTVLVQDLFNGNPGATASAAVRSLGQNESVELGITLNVSTNFLEPHTLRVRVDPDNRVPETNEGNNELTRNYVLAQGGC